MAFDIGIQFHTDLLVTRERMEKTLGEEIGTVCLITQIRTLEQGIRVVGKMCCNDVLKIERIEERLVAAIQNDGLAICVTYSC